MIIFNRSIKCLILQLLIPMMPFLNDISASRRKKELEEGDKLKEYYLKKDEDALLILECAIIKLKNLGVIYKAKLNDSKCYIQA